MKRFKKKVSRQSRELSFGRLKSNSMGQATEILIPNFGERRMSQISQKRKSSVIKSRRKKFSTPQLSIRSEESLPKISSNTVEDEEESEELLIQEIDLSKSVKKLAWYSDYPGQLKEKMYPSKLGIGGRDSCTDICNQKCLDSRIRLPPIKRTKSENICWDVRGISEPQGELKPVQAVERVNLRRKEKHDNILMQLSLKMNGVNEAIEKEIRKQADNVVSHINLIKENVDNILDIIEEKQCVGLSTKVVNRMQEIIGQLNDNRLLKINAFCEFVRKLEMQRSESFKHILRQVYKDMHDNMFLLPYEIQKFFEKKLQHLNQITTNNYHCYTELEGKLKLQMEEETKIWFQKLKMYDKMKEKKVDNQEDSPEPEKEEILHVDIIPNKRRQIAMKLDEAEENYQKLLLVASKSKYLQSHHILGLFRNYLSEMQNVATGLIQTGLLEMSAPQLDNGTIRKLSVRHGINEDEIKEIIKEGIQKLAESLDSNLKIFTHSTRIFDNFVDRNEEVKQFYRQQLFLTEIKNGKTAMQINHNINLLVDTLRQDASEHSLDKTIGEIFSLISNIDTMMLSNLKEGNAFVEKFNQVQMTNVDILIDELGRFVKQFVPPPDSDPRIMKKRASWMTADEMKNNDHLFTDDFLTCRYMIDAINNWQFGVWQAFITIVETSKPAIWQIVTDLSNKARKRLKDRCDLKMKMNNLRMQFIREDFLRIRIVELRIHENRLKQHRLGFDESMVQLNELRREMESTCSNYLESKFLIKMNNSMTALRKVSKKRHLNAIKQNLRYLLAMTLQDTKPTYDRISHTHGKILICLMKSHLKFLKSVRFFSEDGNFTVEEAKYLIKQLNALEKRLSKELIANKDSVKKIHDSFMEDCQLKVGAHINDLDKYLAEYAFDEEIELKFKELNVEVSEGICDVTIDLRKLEENIKSLKSASYAEENLGHIDWLSTSIRCTKEIRTEIESIQEKLAYYEWAPLDEKFLKRKLLYSPIDSMNSARSTKSTAEVQKISLESQESKSRKFERHRSLQKNAPVVKSRNYISILYPSQPQPEDSFLSKLHCKIFDSFCNIQEMAKVFYEKHQEVLNRELVIPEYKPFVEEILAKYKFYQLQLEFAWLESMTELIKLVSNFQKYLDDYYKDTLIKYFEIRKEGLSRLYAEIIKNLETSNKSIEEYYMSAHKKLKTMFGHPNMSNMLKTIEEYIIEADDFGRKTLLDKLNPSKESLKDHCLNTESIFLDLEQMLSFIKGSTQDALKDNLENQLIEKTERMQKILSHVDDSDEEVFDEYNVGQNVARRLRIYKKKAQIPPEVTISYTSIIRRRNTSETSFKLLNTEVLRRENYGDYEIYAEKIESFREKCKAIHQTYKNMWKQDVNRILKLYRVKYDYPI